MAVNRMTRHGKTAVLMLAAALVLAGCAGVRQRQESRADLARLYTEKGAAYLAAGYLERARKDLLTAIRLDPKNAAAHNALGLLYERAGLQKLAEEHYRKSLALDPDYPAALNNYGSHLCRTGRRMEGLTVLERAITPFNPNAWKAMIEAGACALDLGDLDTAERHLRAALDHPYIDRAGRVAALRYLRRVAEARGDTLRVRAFSERLRDLGAETED